MGLTGLGLYLFARERMGAAVSAVVFWHVAAGTVLAAILGLRWALGPRRPLSARGIFLAISAAAGLALVAWALAGRSTGRIPAVFYLHIIAGTAALLLSLRLHPSVSRPPSSVTSMSVLILLLAATGALGAASYAADAYYRSLTATTPEQAGNPLFPAGTRLTGSWSRTPPPEQCGRPGCHPGELHQWLRSIHARAGRDPLYLRALQSAHSGLGDTGIRWCQGCHAPLALSVAGSQSSVVSHQAAGGRQEKGRRGEGEKGRGGDSGIRSHDSRLTTHDSGTTPSCLSCHSIRSVPGAEGNGRADYAPPERYPWADAPPGWRESVNGFLIRLRPAPHVAGLAGPSSDNISQAMCAPCHRLSVTEVQNHYRFLHYDDTWPEWQAGPFSGESLHAMGVAATTRTCMDCHLPLRRGGARDHDTEPALPPVQVEVFALRGQSAIPGGPEQVEAPLDRRTAYLAPGDTTLVDVLVENRLIGHAFPTGVPDLRDAYLEVSVQDGQGRTLLRSAAPHRYGLLPLGRYGHRVTGGSPDSMVAILYRRLIPAGGADVARYRLIVPSGAQGPLRFTARLLYRRIDPASGLPSAAPAVGLAADAAEIGIRGQAPNTGGASVEVASVSAGERDNPADAPRFYRYGAALLRVRDLRKARAAFTQARDLRPQDPENWIGLARAFLEEGDLLSARAQLQQALNLRPGDPRAQAWLARTLLNMGEYDDALRLLRPLAERYPRDRETWFDIGMALYRTGRYEAAEEPFLRMLDVDPDDVSAHLNLMLCYRRLNRLSLARREEAVYRTLQEVDVPEQLLAEYRRTHPADALESLPIHEHVLVGNR